MDFNQIFQFLQTGTPERVAGFVFAFLIVLGILSTLIYYSLKLFFKFWENLFSSFKRKDRIVEVPKYITPPENKEIDKYLTILKKIADDYNNGIKL